ncbi:MAG: GGDEF domain-containing protein, partial [Spirochaetaceae bacterium]|nr:GGDEF domain-containing protein [Spirochaetaceae bacterium]
HHMLQTATSRLQNTGAFLSDMVKWGESARIRAVTDDFTGLYNRRFFDDALKDSIQESILNGRPYSLVILDLDRFGTLNAEYGEAVGDSVIQAAVPVFIGVFDESDILSRYGGDEFAFILPGKTGEEALERCRKVCRGLRELEIPALEKGSFDHLSASIGIATCPIHGENTQELLDRADQALYAAKEAGRDRAVLYGMGKMK